MQGPVGGGKWGKWSSKRYPLLLFTIFLFVGKGGRGEENADVVPFGICLFFPFFFIIIAVVSIFSPKKPIGEN